MKFRVLALLLLLATLTGVFGCSVRSEQTDDLIADDAPQFIGGRKSDALSDVQTEGDYAEQWYEEFKK